MIKIIPKENRYQLPTNVKGEIDRQQRRTKDKEEKKTKTKTKTKTKKMKKKMIIL